MYTAEKSPSLGSDMLDCRSKLRSRDSGAPVIGFDIDPERIRELRDRTREIDPNDLTHFALTLSSEPRTQHESRPGAFPAWTTQAARGCRS
jgi:hypothetical protein